MEKLRMLEIGTVVMGAGYHSHPRAATILLYFQGLSSRQADSTGAQNALRNGDVNDLDPLRPGAREDPPLL
jgi:redox-sensitive bicupin YhaK (pirin superfamily)